MSEFDPKAYLNKKPELDAFQSARFKEDISERFQQIKDSHQIQERRMWVGALVSEFDEYELGVLHDAGFLSLDDVYRLREIYANHSQKREPNEQTS